jgi:hypothetical protein
MKYLSNFRSLEFGGTVYDHGEEIKVRKGEEGAMDVLVREGRVTAVEDGDESVPAGTAGGEAPKSDSDGFDAEAFIARNLDAISDDEIAALTDEARAAVVAAETDREKPRTGLLSRLGEGE